MYLMTRYTSVIGTSRGRVGLYIEVIYDGFKSDRREIRGLAPAGGVAPAASSLSIFGSLLSSAATRQPSGVSRHKPAALLQQSCAARCASVETRQPPCHIRHATAAMAQPPAARRVFRSVTSLAPVRLM